ncbi:MAG: hypothetical protein Kow0026_27190 [Oricola sp.]
MRQITVPAALLCAGFALAACQTASKDMAASTAEPAASAEGAEMTADAAAAYAPADSPAATPRQCTVTIAGGPPPKPAKGADFAQNAVGKNIGRDVGRNAITMIGGRLGGGIGGAVAGGLASNAIRTEQDLKGRWTITDGAPDCGCELDISSATNLQMKTANKGKLSPAGCTSMLAGAARWTLGHTFTGYDAPFQLLGADNKTVIASMKRDGVNYFSGTLADGTPVTMWRRGG